MIMHKHGNLHIHELLVNTHRYGHVQQALLKPCKYSYRKIRHERVDMKYWPLKGPCRIVGYPDASYQNNKPDFSSQKGHAIFIAETRQPDVSNPRASLVDYDSSHHWLIMTVRKLRNQYNLQLWQNCMRS